MFQGKKDLVVLWDKNVLFHFEGRLIGSLDYNGLVPEEGSSDGSVSLESVAYSTSRKV